MVSKFEGDLVYRNALLILFIILQVPRADALTPLESIILGDLSSYYKEEQTDPMSFLFAINENDLDSRRRAVGHRRRLNLTRALINQGKNLELSCQKHTHKLYYAKDWDFEQAKRSTIASMQFLGLDLTVRALAKYAQHFEYTEDQFKKFSERLVNESCSANMTLISRTQLKKYFFNKFIRDNNFKLPDFGSDPYFSSSLEQINSPEKSLEQEFYFTTQIFKSFCSWGNENKKLRFLGSFMRDPILYAYLMNHLSGERPEWNGADELVYLTPDKNTTQVVCRDLICRRVVLNDFNRLFPHSVGSSGVRSDLGRLYCHSFRNYDVQTVEESPTLKKMLSAYTLDQQHLEISQMQALITNIPDLWVRSANYSVVKNLTRSSIDDYWNNWAMAQFKKLDKTILYEEPLTLELVSRHLLFNKYAALFQAGIDINQGEFDRSTEVKGKIKLSYTLYINAKLARWLRGEWRSSRATSNDTMKELNDKMRLSLVSQVEELQQKFRLPPWRGDLTKLIAQELLEQIGTYEGNFFLEDKNSEIPLTVNLYYSPFALRYFHQTYLIEKNSALFKDE